jgi:ribosomal protein S18 acetylase RimI-like enzyme
MSEQLKQSFTIERMKPEDIEAVTEMRLQSWLDTYPNEAAGVTREWIETRNELQRSPEAMERRRKQMEEFGAGWIAQDAHGEVVGTTSPYTDQYGIQHVGLLYVAKEFHGMGVGPALMQKVIEGFDATKPIVLSVVSYNDRAKAFYKKWGFLEIEGSDALFADVIPEIDMVRPGDNQEYPNLHPKLEIKNSPVEGRGIFTKVPIKMGEKLIININPQPVEVHEFTDEEFETFKAECIEQGLQWDSVSIGEGKHRAAIAQRDENPENYGNHSCNPNLSGNHVALRNIEPGEELTVDYAQFSDINWSMECHCGSKNCKGIVKGKVT